MILYNGLNLHRNRFRRDETRYVLDIVDGGGNSSLGPVVQVQPARNLSRVIDVDLHLKHRRALPEEGSGSFLGRWCVYLLKTTRRRLRICLRTLEKRLDDARYRI